MKAPRLRERSAGEDLLVAGLAAFAALQLALGAFMAVAPGTFFEEVGPFGAENDHYVRDLSAWYLAVGAALVVALRKRSWRVPVLAVLLVQFVLHSLNHLIDIDEAEPSSVGVVDFVALVLGTALLAAFLRLALRPPPPSASPGPAERTRG